MQHENRLINLLQHPVRGTFLDAINLVLPLHGLSTSKAESFEESFYARYSWLKKSLG